MSDGESKSAPPSGSKRRRRRRRPAGDQGGSRSSGAGETSSTPSSVASSSSPSKGGKRRRGGRSRQRGEAASGGEVNSSESRRGRSRRKPGGESNASSDSSPPRREAASPARSESRKPSEDLAPRLTPQRPTEDLAPAPREPAVRWGDDSDAPTPDIALAQDLPANAPSDDWDPASASLAGYDGQLSARICNVIGVRFVPAGRIYMYDAGDGQYGRGDEVVVEGDRGQRSAVVAAASVRRPPPRSLKRILRRGTPEDREAETADSEQMQSHLSTAKALAKELSLPIKVFRASFEDDNKKLAVYYSCDDKTDVRPLTRALSDALPVRVDLRHTGVRDEAKLVGGIGACGQELCCTTWLPSFVPVSIKHAKDQGLVLNPTKISGQCGRLKCCLVYEQENYAKLRKGLPKLGKRVITHDGFEGRVIELDVLHQRIRVSVGRGESKVYKKGEVEPMFASQPQGSAKGNKNKDKKSSRGNDRERNDGNDNDNDNETKGEEPNHDKH